MPRMDGVEATRRIMARTPCAIVVVTANVSDHSSKVFEAMGAGALDAVNTPVLERPERTRRRRGAAGKDRNHPQADRRRPREEPVALPPPRRAASRSAPQPPDRHRRLRRRPDGPGQGAGAVCRPIFPPPWSSCSTWTRNSPPGLASWLDGQTALHVRLAREGDRPEAGTALLAGQDRSSRVCQSHAARLIRASPRTAPTARRSTCSSRARTASGRAT